MKRKTILILAAAIVVIVAASSGRLVRGVLLKYHLLSGRTPTALNDVTALDVEGHRPNIILVMVDDMDSLLGTIDHMPNLKEHMIDKGLSFEHFFITTPICCPARASFLRGQYTHNHETFMNRAPEGGYKKFNLMGNEASTISTWLQAAGYETAFMGKYMNEYPFQKSLTYVPPGWTEWYSPVKGAPYTGFSYTLNENGTLVDYSRSDEYITDVLANKASVFISQSTATPNPFFLLISTYAPHEPFTPAARHEALFSDLEAPQIRSFNEDDVSDKPTGMNSNPPFTEKIIQLINEHYRLRVQSMQAVDEMILNLFETLADTRQLENTYVFFVSDNGFHLGQHRLPSGKGSAYEEDIRVPFIVRGPGVNQGEVISEYFAANIDLGPTLAELGGVIPPEFVDGRSLVPLFGNDKPQLNDWRKAILIEFYGFFQEGLNWFKPQPVYLEIRSAVFAYIEHDNGFVELYDMRKDPFQLENIASTVDPALVEEFSNWVQAMLTCAGEKCRQADMYACEFCQIPDNNE